MIKKIKAFLGGLLLTLLSDAHAALIEGIRVDDSGRDPAIYFMYSGQARPSMFVLKHPDRLVIDFPKSSIRFPIKDVVLSKQLISGVRSGQPSPNTLRLVFDLNAPIQYQRAPWMPPVQGRGGLRVALHGLGAKPSLAINSYGAPSNPLFMKPTPVMSSRPSRAPVLEAGRVGRGRDIVVAIDAGHGGKDPGAIGPSRYPEKYVTLSIAQKLKYVIDREPGMRAVLTRRGDYYIPLRERLNIARKAKADIFISIHADAFKNKASHGASVFALSARGATSEAARWLAEKENYSELGGVNLKGLDDRSGWVRTVLIDLSQTATINSSLNMGTQVLGELGRFATLHNHHVEQAGFLVLKSPDTPSILVETGFISNPTEERNLSSQGYQSRLAKAICQGVKNYFRDNPPRGSRFDV